MSSLPKYYGKIKNFISTNTNLFGNISEYDKNPTIESSVTLKMIYDTICETGKSNMDKSNTEYNEPIKMKAMHSNDTHPLVYHYFTILYNENIIKDIPNISNFSEFYSWYKNTNNSINYGDIDRTIAEMKSNIKKDTNTNNENINLLITLHDLINNTEEPRSILHSNIYHNRFLSIDIQQNLETNDLIYQNIKITSKDNTNDNKDNANIHLFYPANSSNTKPDIELIIHIIKAMDVMHKKSKHSSINNLDLTIILSTQKKMFDNSDNQLSAENINSGSTYPGRTVTVWRLEELYKVLIHELIHFHCFDFGHNHPQYNLLEKKMKNVINFEGTDSINEAYTETLAVIINSMFYAYYNNLQDLSIKNIELTFHDSLNLERRFLMWQVSKIVHMFGGNDLEVFLDNKIKIDQTTSVRSYYIYKLFLFFNLSEFVTFIDNQNEKCGINICDRLEEFGNLINRSYEIFKSNKKIINNVNNCIKLINIEHNKNNSKNPWIYRTGRMSATEIK
jgi:hypothetical protein